MELRSDPLGQFLIPVLLIVQHTWLLNLCFVIGSRFADIDGGEGKAVYFSLS